MWRVIDSLSAGSPIRNREFRYGPKSASPGLTVTQMTMLINGSPIRRASRNRLINVIVRPGLWTVNKRHVESLGPYLHSKSHSRICQPTAHLGSFRFLASAALLHSQLTAKNPHPELHSIATNPEPGCSRLR